MTKRKFKKKYKPNRYTRTLFHRYIQWINLYKLELKKIKEQKQGKYKDCIFFPGISKSYIKYYQELICGQLSLKD